MCRGTKIKKPDIFLHKHIVASSALTKTNTPYK
uniref:Uncharacterized protein n=1 Tax=Anguilla anguilla TaxID=7936 RepID=A0A0E9UC36_ANGAN